MAPPQFEKSNYQKIGLNFFVSGLPHVAKHFLKLKVLYQKVNFPGMCLISGLFHERKMPNKNAILLVN